MPPKAPAVTAARKSESRHGQFWYPHRCELPGCDAHGADLKKWSACHMVMYCGEQHQKADWKDHKEECKVFRRLGLRSTFYRDEDMLARSPLRPRGSPDRNVPHAADAAECPLCLKPEGSVPITHTTCCGQPVCDTSGDYEMFSFSREHCERSHDRYTLCGYHGVEAHCDRAKDWRECAGCIARGDAPDRLWRGLNSCNFCPMISKDVPRHARCDRCDGCGKQFIAGMEGCMSSGSGTVCLRCSPFT